ncbi:MAG: thioredoxin [Clostridia bacterium]|nr:thioredoxin [Clostridia bacterium]NCC77083.1 thioredoxin [Clostridia bacterium]
MESIPTVIDLTLPTPAIEQAFSEVPLLLIHFSSPTCSVCHSTLPQLQQLAAAYAVPVVDVSIDTHPEVAAQRLVFTVPTILVLAEGKEMLRESRFIGFDRIDRLLGLMTEG